MKKFLINILFVFPGLFIRADAQTSEYTEHHYTTVEGLASNFIHDVKWDDKGFIWISGSRGISRFDGTWVETYNTKSKPSLHADYCTPLTINALQKDIFCDERGFIYGFSANKPVLLDSSHAVHTKANFMAVMLPFQFWNSLFSTINPLYHIYNEPVVIDSTRFLITDNDKLIVYDLNSHGYKLVKQFSSSLKLFKISNRIFIYEAKKGLYEINNRDSITTSAALIGFDANTSIIFWRNGMAEAILVESKKSYLLQLKDNMLVKGKQICDRLPDFISINNIKYDSISSTMAVATEGNGLYLYKPKTVTTYRNHSASVRFSVKSYDSQVQLEPGSLLLGPGEKLNLTDNTFYPDKTLPDFVNGYKVKDSLLLIHARDGYIWTYNYNSHRLNRYFDSRSSDAGAFAVVDNKLFFTNNTGVSELKENGATLICKFTRAFPQFDPVAIDAVQFKPGYLVFSGCHGTFGFNINNRKIDTLIPEEKGLCVRGMTVFKDYILLAAYGKGLWIYRDKKLKQMPADIRQLTLYSHTIITDQYENAWIGANSGIFRTKVQEMINAFNNGTLVGYEYYGKDEGMDITELNGGRQSSVLRLSNGNLSYTGINGLVSIDINKVQQKKNGPVSLFFDKLLINDSLYLPLTDASPPVLPVNTKRVRLYFSIPGREDFVPVVLSYRIKGIISHWERINFFRQNYVDINGLPAGEHTIEFNYQQASVPQAIHFNFRIAAPWYSTWVFYTWLSVLGLLFIAFLFRWRNRQLLVRNKQLASKVDIHLQDIRTQKIELEKQVSEMEEYQQKLEEDYALKNRLISIIGHDIITPLRFMNRAGNMLMANKNTIDREVFDDTLKTIRETGISLEDMSANMLNWIKNHQDNMRFVISDFDISVQVLSVIQSVTLAAEFKNITIINEIQSGITLHQFRDPLKTILQQLLMNAVKYSEKGTVVVQLKEKELNVELSVKDEGVGMPDELVNHLMDINEKRDFNSLHEKKGLGFGFIIIKDMLKIIRGTFSIASREAEGTTITLIFPAEIDSE
jgi:signal transduction histidine kinase